MSHPNVDPSPLTRSHVDHGSFVLCGSCSRRSDIWAEQCGCGVELLPDDRKVKLAKSGSTPTARMTRRANKLAAEGSMAALEQAVRDLSVLRAGAEGGKQSDVPFTSQIVRHLIKLDQLDGACAEAESLPTSGTGAVLSVDAVESLARALHSHDDARAERWLRRALQLKARGKEHLELQCALVGVLVRAGREPEALEGFEQAVGELDALRKKTSKSSLVVLAGGSGDAFADGYWGQATSALDTLRKPVVGATAAVAVAEGGRALMEAQRLERSGDIPAARDAAGAAAVHLSTVVKRLKPLAGGLSKSDSKDTMEPVETVVRTLDAEHRRLKKLAKHSRG